MFSSRYVGPHNIAVGCSKSCVGTQGDSNSAWAPSIWLLHSEGPCPRVMLSFTCNKSAINSSNKRRTRWWRCTCGRSNTWSYTNKDQTEQSSRVVYRAEYPESELSISSTLDFDLKADVLNVSQELYKSSFTLISPNNTAGVSKRQSMWSYTGPIPARSTPFVCYAEPLNQRIWR